MSIAWITKRKILNEAIMITITFDMKDDKLKENYEIVSSYACIRALSRQEVRRRLVRLNQRERTLDVYFAKMSFAEF